MKVPRHKVAAFLHNLRQCLGGIDIKWCEK